MNAFGISPAPKPALRMVMDGAAQLDAGALYDAIQIIADQLPAETLETLSNELGRAAHMKQRNAPVTTTTARADEAAGLSLPVPAASY